MESEEKDIRTIDSYLDKELTGSEKETVEKRLETDPGFRALMDEIKLFREGSEVVFRGQVRDFLEKKDQEMGPVKEPGGKQIKIGRLQWMYGVAAAIILFVVGYILLQITFSSSPTSAELFEAYYEPYPNLIEAQQRGESNKSMEELDMAISNYESGNYMEAAAGFSRLDDKEKEGLVWLYEGISYIESDSIDQAIASLKEARKREVTLEWQCQWYQGLAYLKFDHNNEAKIIFEKLTVSDNPFRDRSTKILNQLKN